MQVSSVSGQNIVITGARGFIGSRVLNSLIAGGAQITAILRTGHEAKKLRQLGARVEVTALKRGTALENALEGQDTLINTAYDIRAGMDENLAAFEALIDAAGNAGIKRVIHTSSAVVYDDWPQGEIDENSPITAGAGGGYRQAKIMMENILLRGDFEVIILQPTIVYGSGSALWTTGPMAALTGGGVVLPDPSGHCAAVHVDDVVQAFVKAVEVADIKQEKFLISGADRPSWQRFYGGYRDILGGGEVLSKPANDLQARLAAPNGVEISSGPSAAAKISARLRQLIGTNNFENFTGKIRAMRGSGAPHYPDQHMLTLLAASPLISIEHARTRLGYEPQVDFEKGLAEIRAGLS